MTIFHEPQCLISSNLIGLRYFDIIIIFASKYIKIIYIFFKKLFLILNQNDLKVYKNNFKLFFFQKYCWTAMQNMTLIIFWNNNFA
jgi:hypothetical protein